MGLTIHYRLGTDDPEVHSKLRSLWMTAKDMQRDGLLAEVSELVYWTGKDHAWHLDAANQSEWRWAAIQTGKWVEYQNRWKMRNYSRQAAPRQGYIFRTWPMEGCEEANFGLFTYPATILIPLSEYDQMVTGRKHRRIKVNVPTMWYWSSFCKTTYAEKPVSAHLAVVSLLDEAKRLNLLQSVSDESDYWDHRNLVELAHEFGQDHVMLANFASYLKDMWPDTDMVAPIMMSEVYQDIQRMGGSTLDLLHHVHEVEPVQYDEEE